MWQNTQFPADLVAITEKNLNGKLNFWCSAPEMFFEKVFFKILQYSQQKQLCWGIFSNKGFFVEHVRVTSSVSSQDALPNQVNVRRVIEVCIIGTMNGNWVMEVGI